MVTEIPTVYDAIVIALANQLSFTPEKRQGLVVNIMNLPSPLPPDNAKLVEHVIEQEKEKRGYLDKMLGLDTMQLPDQIKSDPDLQTKVQAQVLRGLSGGLYSDMRLYRDEGSQFFAPLLRLSALWLSAHGYEDLMPPDEENRIGYYFYEDQLATLRDVIQPLQNNPTPIAVKS